MLRVTGIARVPELNKQVYVATLKSHTVLLTENQLPIAKDCNSCGNMYTLDEFYKDKYNLFNRTFTCKHCRAEVGRRFRQDNPKYYRRYLIENRERTLADSRRWYRNNPVKAAVYYSRKAERRQLALQNSLPDDKEYLTAFNSDKTCVLTGVSVDTALDHVMPVAVGTWGNTKGNLMWLYSRLNNSKGSANVFEWAADMEQERLDYLLPESVTMTTEEFRGKVAAALTVKAEELGLTFEQFKQKYNEEYYREEQEI